MHRNSIKNRGYMYLIIEYVLFTIVLYLYSPFIQIFAKRIGAKDIHIALLNAAPALVAILVLVPCSILIEKLNHKKKTILVLLFINSLFYAAISFVPAISNKIRVILYVVLIGLMNWPNSLYNSTVQSFIADNFDGPRLNRIISLRSKYGALFGFITVLITGLLLTNVPGSDRERLLLYQIFYGMCFLLTILQMGIFSRIDLQQSSWKDNKQSVSILQSSILKDMISNKSYLVFCICGFVFYYTWQMGWPLISIYFIDYAGLNEFQISLVSVVTGLSQFLTYSMWNRLIDKKGCRMVIIFGAAGIAINAFFFTTKLNFSAILAAYLLYGVSQGCYLLSVNCGLLEVVPPGGNTVYISIFNMITNITGFLAPLTGVWLYNQTSIYLALGLIGIFRWIAIMLYIIRWKYDKDTVMKCTSENIKSGV